MDYYLMVAIREALAALGTREALAVLEAELTPKNANHTLRNVQLLAEYGDAKSLTLLTALVKDKAYPTTMRRIFHRSVWLLNNHLFPSQKKKYVRFDKDDYYYDDSVE